MVDHEVIETCLVPIPFKSCTIQTPTRALGDMFSANNRIGSRHFDPMSLFCARAFTSSSDTFSSITQSGYFKPRAKFSPADDEELRHLVGSLGQMDWSAIAERMPGKNARQCKERWANYLAPSLNTAAWTIQDDLMLIQKYAELGSKWVQIAAFFPNRTDAMIKNRFNKLQRRDQKHRELLLRGEFAFMIPLLHAALAGGVAQPKPAALTQPPIVIEEDDHGIGEMDGWAESFCFTEDMCGF
jgi:hypothetical protein